MFLKYLIRRGMQGRGRSIYIGVFTTILTMSMKVKVCSGGVTQEMEVCLPMTLKISGEVKIEVERPIEFAITSESGSSTSISVVLQPPFTTTTREITVKSDSPVEITLNTPVAKIERALLPKAPRGTVEKKILEALGSEELTSREISERTGHPLTAIQGRLTRMKEKGLVVNVDGKWRKAGLIKKDQKEVRSLEIPVIEEVKKGGRSHG
jgi:hypothetical protein